MRDHPRVGRPKGAPTMCVDGDVVGALNRSGPDWHMRADSLLRDALAGRGDSL